MVFPKNDDDDDDDADDDDDDDDDDGHDDDSGIFIVYHYPSNFYQPATRSVASQTPDQKVLSAFRGRRQVGGILLG